MARRSTAGEWVAQPQGPTEPPWVSRGSLLVPTGEENDYQLISVDWAGTIVPVWSMPLNIFTRDESSTGTGCVGVYWWVVRVWRWIWIWPESSQSLAYYSDHLRSGSEPLNQPGTHTNIGLRIAVESAMIQILSPFGVAKSPGLETWEPASDGRWTHQAHWHGLGQVGKPSGPWLAHRQWRRAKVEDLPGRFLEDLTLFWGGNIEHFKEDNYYIDEQYSKIIWGLKLLWLWTLSWELLAHEVCDWKDLYQLRVKLLDWGKTGKSGLGTEILICPGPRTILHRSWSPPRVTPMQWLLGVIMEWSHFSKRGRACKESRTLIPKLTSYSIRPQCKQFSKVNSIVWLWQHVYTMHGIIYIYIVHTHT